jgi:hypothetical protein
MRNLGIGILSALFCASLIGACSASGNDPVGTGGTGTGGSDSGAAADTSVTYTYDAGPDNVVDSGSTVTPIDSGSSTPIDSGPAPTSADCDLSGASAFTYFTDLSGGTLPPCGTGDSCPSGQCCVNIASAASLPPEFASLFGATPGCDTE